MRAEARTRVALVGLAGALALGAGCDTPCAYRILDRIERSGEVGCCGAFAVEEIDVPDERDLAVDVALEALPAASGGQDVWVAPADCARLFEGPYAAPGSGPRPEPRCQVIAGPVSPGRVSPRARVVPGRYRVFVQAYSANRSTSAHRVTISVWGASCQASPTAP